MAKTMKAEFKVWSKW